MAYLRTIKICFHKLIYDGTRRQAVEISSWLEVFWGETSLVFNSNKFLFLCYLQVLLLGHF